MTMRNRRSGSSPPSTSRRTGQAERLKKVMFCATLAHIAAELGITVCAPRQDGTKAPWADSWKDATMENFTVEETDAWYAREAFTGFGFFLGELSGGLVMTELEGRAVGSRSDG